ncbi:uncharacterized protein LOC113873709 [Abrus precatorius]|uniref:Uncharacterized protein LOC113873709 n=1 Tax=Abrus precatorius TaxID=3816 RepID=A0A8B8MIP2_ABRPR|nr:uncharacterized protein LOC113873709 [Abrus precatorius]
MEIRKVDGNTPFCMAAISGNVEIATILLEKNPNLVWSRGHKDMLPIHLASSAGHPRMVEFLFQNTRQDIHINLPFPDIVTLFFLTITNNIYTVAWNLLDKYPILASTENEERRTPLQVLAQLPLCQNAPGYQDILSLLFEGMEEEFLNSERTSEAMFDAAKSGNVMILEFIFKYNPALLTKVNSEGQSLLHIAILHRHVTVYRLIKSKGAYKNVMLQLVDYDGNNVLHLAGKLAAEGRFGSPMHQVLICSEELWFKEVEKTAPPALKTKVNRDGWRPREVFYREHKELSEKAVCELNGIANNFLVVGTLVVTLGISAALTIRTNNISGETPVFDQNRWYIIFIVSVAFGISFCAVSMLLFTSVILPSKWMPDQCFVSFRLTRIVGGCLLLYASVGILGTISVMSGTVLVYNFFPKWIFCAIASLSAIPVILSFVIYHYSLYLAKHLILAFCEEAAMRTLSRVGIKWTPFYFG